MLLPFNLCVDTSCISADDNWLRNCTAAATTARYPLCLQLNLCGISADDNWLRNCTAAATTARYPRCLQLNLCVDTSCISADDNWLRNCTAAATTARYPHTPPVQNSHVSLQSFLQHVSSLQDFGQPHSTPVLPSQILPSLMPRSIRSLS